MLRALRELFWTIHTQKKKSGTVAPNQFIQKLKQENELFRGTMHQDAHEFLIYIVNTVAEDIVQHERQSGKLQADAQATTWLHQVFQGILTNETRCLTCETISNRDESFIDLSIDIDQHTSITHCLRQFSASEMLCQRDKFYCDTCCGLQEAQKRMKIKQLPSVLTLHLKRFKYQERLQKHVKLSYRVVFPLELRLPNTCDDTVNADRLYQLFAFIVHIGNGPHHGHYITIAKSMGQWMLFDDDSVQMIDEARIKDYYGDHAQKGAGYVLFYRAAPEDQHRL
jgi:ubiquitin carboxyl-terminal hydrolase 9/13